MQKVLVKSQFVWYNTPAVTKDALNHKRKKYYVNNGKKQNRR